MEERERIKEDNRLASSKEVTDVRVVSRLLA